MKKTIKTIILILFTQFIFGQQNNSMYFMQSLSQSKWLNPALQSEYRTNVSGLAVPIFGQILVPVHLNYGNNSLSLNKILQYNSDIDVLAFPGYKGFDKKKLFNHLKKHNTLSLETHLNLLSVGIKYDEWYFELDIHQKMNAYFSLSDNFIKFALDGNAGDEFLGKTSHIGDLGINITSYTEYALSASKPINEKLTVGASIKMLIGQANLWAEKSVLNIHTSNADNYPTTLTADVLIHSSQPMVDIKDFYYDTQGDSIVIDSLHKKINPSQVFFNTNNIGFGLDLGATYKLNNKIDLYASVTDLGYIRWKGNANSFKLQGEYYWDGYDFQPLLTKDDDIIGMHNDSIKKDLINILDTKYKSNSYTTYLGPRIYLGGTYLFNEKIKTGLLLRGAINNKHLYSSATLSGNFKITKWFESVASYSVINNTFNNVGLGYVVRLGAIQFYMMSDNVLGMIIPQNTQNINFRMGINLAFGRKKKKEKNNKK